MSSKRLGFKPVEEDAAVLRTWMGARAGGAGTAPNDASFLVLAVNADLVNERVFTAGDGLDGTDDGAGSTYTLDVDVTDFIDTAYGLTEDTNNIRVAITANEGLEFNAGTGALEVDVTDFIDTAYGLTEDTNNIRINIGDGLEFDTGALEVDLVDAWSGLEFVTGDLRVDQDEAFTWTGVHTHAANVILDDGIGDSPQLHFVAGTNDDTAMLFLKDAPGNDDSDLIMRLCDEAGDSLFSIQNRVFSEVANIDSMGNAMFRGKMRASDEGIRTKTVYASITDPPTEAEIEAAFGSAMTAGDGFIGILISE